MGIFSRLFAPKETDSARFVRLEAKLRELDEVVDKQQRTIKALELDWEQTYDKMAHLMARITKRRAALAADQEREQAASQAPEQPNGIAAGGSLPLGTHSQMQAMRARHGLLPR